MILILVPVSWIAISALASNRVQNITHHQFTTSKPFISDKMQKQSIVGKPLLINGLWMITVTNVSTSHGGNVASPAPGDIYLVVEVALKNRATNVQTVSHALMFTFRDSTGRQYKSQNVSFGAQPDGVVPPGGSLHGFLVYEVPTSLHQFTLGFRPDASTNSWTDWNITI